MAYTHSTAPALRLMPCGPHSVASEETIAAEARPMIPANIFKTRGHPLARMHGDWGVAFVGTKAELQAAGFGVGAVFPGEPGGNKKKAVLSACNGFPRVEVELYGHCTYLGEPSQTELQNYVVRARYLPDQSKRKREFERTQCSGVVLHRAIWFDVYRGTSEALIAANLASIQQFPGQPGCGKVRTTFDRDGRRVVQGSTTAGHEGNRTVLVAGKLFEVWVQVSDAERDFRHARWSVEFDARRAELARDVAALFRQHQSEPTKHHLRLVWSV